MKYTKSRNALNVERSDKRVSEIPHFCRHVLSKRSTLFERKIRNCLYTYFRRNSPPLNRESLEV